uniref:Small ribosomal subunit protein uS9c n=1 Tax=Nephroselmis pyriformis TaxID=156128 RepID=A0A8A2H863_9CHLO|nr:ribosomal protein S9 [Nephroselmis pyriformis]QSV37292.1 ribosomal protein S9 [Nephroselmis pyriformis]
MYSDSTFVAAPPVVHLGTGRRKSSRAQVRLVPGTGQLIINGKPGMVYLNYNPAYLSAVQAPLDLLGMEQQYDTIVTTQGGGLTGQAEAIKLGVARALCQIDPSNRTPLKIEGHLTRNSLCKERKKYGLKKARKAPQFSKR